MNMKNSILAKPSVKINDNASSEPVGPMFSLVSVKVPFFIYWNSGTCFRYVENEGEQILPFATMSSETSSY